jgi:hypothetical protein
MVQCGHECDMDQIATALRRLADGIQSGDVHIEKINFGATLAVDEIVRHTMAMSLVYAPKGYS